MAKTETKTATAVELELPPNGGNLSVVSTLEDDAHYLRVTLDKSENFKVAAGERLRDLLINKFANNRNALRDWYEATVVNGKEHRAWDTVRHYLGVVIKYGEAAAQVFAEREERVRAYDRERDRGRQRVPKDGSRTDENINEINDTKTQFRPVKSEYERRERWLQDMSYTWFKGEREWQDRWLQDRGLSRTRRL